MKVPYAGPSYGEEECEAVAEVLADYTHMVSGAAVQEFEEQVSKSFGLPIGVMVNSGSSANLLALAALPLGPGEEVITPVLTYSTTVAPIVQLGLKPVFVDVNVESYVVDVAAVEAAITLRTRALFIPLLLGNMPNMYALQALAHAYGLFLVLDACDTLGGLYNGKPVGSFADVVTASFYATHIITTAGGGGMVCFANPKLADRARLLAYWGRESTLFGHGDASEDVALRYDASEGEAAYDAKFSFIAQGYNFQPLELQGAFGLVQMKRLEEFILAREQNWCTLYAFFEGYQEYFMLPMLEVYAEPVWLSFPVQVRPDVPFTRNEFAVYLEEHGVQTRPIMTGNILRQPGFVDVGHGEFPNADTIMKNGLMLGCHQSMTVSQLVYVQQQVLDFLHDCEKKEIPVAENQDA